MNTQVALMLCVSVVTALPQVPLGGYPNLDPGLSSSPSTTTLNPLAEPLSTPKPPDMTKDQMNTAPPSAAQAVAAGPVGAVRPINPFGPQFFGPGVNNPYAFPPNPVLVQRAKQVTATNPNVKVFVDTTGEVLFTDHYGREVEIMDQFGMDPLEILPPGEQTALIQERMAAQGGLFPGAGLYPGAGGVTGAGLYPGAGGVPGAGLYPGAGGVATAAGATPSRQVGVGTAGGFPAFTPIYTIVPP